MAIAASNQGDGLTDAFLSVSADRNHRVGPLQRVLHRQKIPHCLQGPLRHEEHEEQPDRDAGEQQADDRRNPRRIRVHPCPKTTP